jgi:exonuclease SbcD
VKLLHVSDWHLGRATYGASRTGDQEAVLDQMVEHARAFGPDLIVHTGDLFDSVRPSYEDMHRGFDALERLSALAPVVVLRGNHDSAVLFSMFARLLGKRPRITFVEQAKRPRDGGILHFESAAGHRIRLAALPFVHANRMVDAFEDAGKWTAQYADRIHVIEEALGKGLLEGMDQSRDVLVFAAHLHVDGATFSGSERPIHVGDHYASKVERLPPLSYAAFGHIHRPQDLPGTTVTGAYAGSPLQLDFGEVGEEKRVIAVEAEPGRSARVTSIPLTAGRRLESFTGTLEQLQAAADGIGDALCKLIIDTAEPEPELSRRVREMLPRATVVDVKERCAAHRVQALDERADAGEAREPGMDELFHEYLERMGGTHRAEAGRVRAVFAAALAALEAEELPAFDEDKAFEAGPGDAPGDAVGEARRDARSDDQRAPRSDDQSEARGNDRSERKDGRRKGGRRAAGEADA